MKYIFSLFLGLCCVQAFQTNSCTGQVRGEQTAEGKDSDQQEKLLFVGNSFTFWNGGINKHVVELAKSAKRPKAILGDKICKGGATLQVLYDQPKVREKIKTEQYDFVVVQGDIPEAKDHNVESFKKHARLFAGDIKSNGGTPVLFMAWPYKRLGWISLDEIVRAHQDVGHELGIRVAPVGLAFENAERQRPGLTMLGKDQEHQSMHGTYLAAGVIYATVFGESPEGCSYRPRQVEPEDAAFLRRVAFDAVKSWEKGFVGKEARAELVK